jgi:5-methylcytosine-specific restriction endonuclease McrA
MVKKLTSLTFNEEGHAKHMQNGIEYSDVTLKMEVHDNSDKAIRQNIRKNDEDYIKFIDNIGFFSVLDTGKGLSHINIKKFMLEQYNIDEHKEVGVSKSGIGVNYFINNSIDNRGLIYILSKTDNCDEYAFQILTKIDGVIKILEEISCSLPAKGSCRELIDQYITNDGMYIVVIKSALYDESADYEYYIDILKEHIDKNNEFKPDLRYTETINDFKEALKFLCISTHYKLYLNNELIIPDNFIHDDDIKMLTAELFYLQQDNIYYINCMSEQISYKINALGNVSKAKDDIKYKKGTLYAKITYYKNDNTQNNKIQYKIKNERNICFCNWNWIDGLRASTNQYLKCNVELSNTDEIKNEILTSVKTNPNFKDQTPTGKLLSINKMISKIIVDDKILNMNGWAYVKWNKTEGVKSDSGNLCHVHSKELEKNKTPKVSYLYTSKTSLTTRTPIKSSKGKKTTPTSPIKTPIISPTPDDTSNANTTVNVIIPNRKRETVTSDIREKLWDELYPSSCKFECVICDKSDYPFNFEISHIISNNNGGSETIENLTLLCRTCNRSMQTTDVKQYVSEKFPKKQKLIIGKLINMNKEI